jgi:hypothetical protein
MRRTSARGPVAAGVAVLMALSLFACSGDDDESAGTTTTTEAGSDDRGTSSDDGESIATADEQGMSTNKARPRPT